MPVTPAQPLPASLTAYCVPLATPASWDSSNLRAFAHAPPTPPAHSLTLHLLDASSSFRFSSSATASGKPSLIASNIRLGRAPIVLSHSSWSPVQELSGGTEGTRVLGAQSTADWPCGFGTGASTRSVSFLVCPQGQRRLLFHGAVARIDELGRDCLEQGSCSGQCCHPCLLPRGLWGEQWPPWAMKFLIRGTCDCYLLWR